ncbi:ShlB/FhaC/HecB family hemolysin secretion/activation protein [Haemophilus haemoglobinophilus]|nr:ShlB/FhaC/HecB family hemolysin secretion/activation protein [Canicola haemoglobinophilus]
MRVLFYIPLILMVGSVNAHNATHLFSENQRESQLQLLDIQKSRQENWLKQHEFQATDRQTPLENLSNYCLPYHNLVFIGVTLIDPTPFAPKENECLSENRLNQLSRDITNAYLKEGYIHNPFQFEDDETGVLRMNVKEGKVVHIRSQSSRLNSKMLFPHLMNSKLKIQDLDQGLDQAAKLASSNVSVDVLPSKNGNIELVFSSDDSFPVNGHLELNNNASKQYGMWQLKSAMSIDNTLGLSDSLYFVAQSTLKDWQKKYSRSVNFYHSIPYGYWSFNTFASYSYFRSPIQLPFSQAVQKGRTWQAGVKTDYTFHRGKNHISTASLQLERIDARSFFNDSLLDIASYKLTTLQANLNHLQLFSQSSLGINLNYERGLKWWGALADQGKDQPQGQFNKWNIDLSWRHYFYLKDKYLLNYFVQLSGQYSDNYLPSSKQVELLSDNSVIGFRQFSLSAEKQVVLKNQLAWLYSIKDWKIEPKLYLDIGAQKATGQESHTIKAFGYGLGLRLAKGNFETTTQIARGKVIKEGLTESTFKAFVRFYF